MRKCSKCKQLKPRSDFYTRTVRGKAYPTSHCKRCHTHYACEKAKKDRQLVERRPYYVVRDTVVRDRDCVVKNDLTVSFVTELFRNGCAYCGVQHTVANKLGLDRKNNAFGHTQENVVPACDCCNRTRGNMPYEAWLHLAKVMRKVRQLGLLDGWCCR